MISTGANVQSVKQNTGLTGNEEQSGITTDLSNASPAKKSALETINETNPNANELKNNIGEIKKMPAALAITGKKQSIEDYASGGDFSNINGHGIKKHKNLDIENQMKAENSEENQSVMVRPMTLSGANSIEGISTKPKL